jgi:hypothetical protein
VRFDLTFAICSYPLSKSVSLSFYYFPDLLASFLRPSARAIGNFATLAIDDPHKVVKVIASEGKSGETKEISYSNCKIIGNGSFGVVFQAKLLGVPKDLEDIAIKKVLQDKRFKVRFGLRHTFCPLTLGAEP